MKKAIREMQTLRATTNTQTNPRPQTQTEYTAPELMAQCNDI